MKTLHQTKDNIKRLPDGGEDLLVSLLVLWGPRSIAALLAFLRQ